MCYTYLRTANLHVVHKTYVLAAKEILKIVSIYVLSTYLLVVTKDEGIVVIDAELEPEIQRWDCYCGYRWTRCY